MQLVLTVPVNFSKYQQVATLWSGIGKEVRNLPIEPFLPLFVVVDLSGAMQESDMSFSRTMIPCKILEITHYCNMIVKEENNCRELGNFHDRNKAGWFPWLMNVFVFHIPFSLNVIELQEKNQRLQLIAKDINW